MPFAQGDSAVGWNFKFSVDGIECPEVIDISSMAFEVDKIESKTQTKDGKFIISQMPGRQKPGELTVTRQLTQSKTMDTWVKDVVEGKITAARKTAKVEVLDFAFSPVKTYEFKHVWCTKVETSEFKAGSTDAVTEKMTLTYSEVEVR